MKNDLIKMIKDNGIRDGLLLNYAWQPKRNKKAITDSIDSSIALRELEIAALIKIKGMVLDGEV